MDANESAKSPFANPWLQLIIGVICMAAVANLSIWLDAVRQSDRSQESLGARCDSNCLQPVCAA